MAQQPKISESDLQEAADWLDFYEPLPDEDQSRMRRVAQWLREEADRRRDKALVGQIARELKAPAKEVREKLKQKGLIGKNAHQPHGSDQDP